MKNAGKIKGGRPELIAAYTTTGTWEDKNKVLPPTVLHVRDQIIGTNYFSSVNVKMLGFNEICDEWQRTSTPTEATFSVLGELSMPAMENVSEAIIVIARAKEFVNSVLCEKNGSIRNGIFEQNVRHFLGRENEVNEKIQSTLKNITQRDKFPLLNNGVTIISKEIRRIAQTVTLRDFQIVNGCQTSHVLYENRDSITDDVIITIKAISSNKDEIIDDIVVATNSQTKVAQSQFLASKREILLIQKFFETYPSDQHEQRKLFFERRTGEFSERNITAVRIFDIHLLGKVFASMFLDMPHDALGSPSRIHESDLLYAKKDIEIAYYTAAFAYYRLILMIGNNLISREDSKYKWYILLAVRHINFNGINIESTPQSIKHHCEKILRIMWKPPAEVQPMIQKALLIVKSTATNPTHELKSKIFTDKLISEIRNQGGK